jgi:hypothetical protein
VAYSYLDTAAQRPATGLDIGARDLIVNLVGDVIAHRQSHASAPELIVGVYFHDRYGGLDDYVTAVRSVWGERASFFLDQAISEARTNATFSFTLGPRVSEETAVAITLLRSMPEPDFRLAVEATLRYLESLQLVADRVTAICRNRGVPWLLDPEDGFMWIGDDVIEREIVQPALTILNDRRFARGVRVEFEHARTELKLGTPQARKHVLTEASAAVESAMKVVLTERRVAYASKDAAQKLFEHLRDNGLVARDTEEMVLAVPRARNKRGGHGAGAVAHDVRQAEAEAFIAAAATAIVFLGKLLQ